MISPSIELQNQYMPALYSVNHNSYDTCNHIFFIQMYTIKNSFPQQSCKNASPELMKDGTVIVHVSTYY